MANSSHKMGEAVRPIFVGKSVSQVTFGGTGFFVENDQRNLYVTANHVLADWDKYYILIPPPTHGFTLPDVLVEANRLITDQEHDLVILETSYKPTTSLKIATEQTPNNLRVGSIEYSRFTIDQGAGKLSQNSSTRIGNVVRDVIDEHYPFTVFELSYPALRGASGAPVINIEGAEAFRVIGVVVSNAQYELMPVQKYSYKGDDGEEEQVHYYLPSALAIPIEHLINLLNKI
jgi:hypothetical protein